MLIRPPFGAGSSPDRGSSRPSVGSVPPDRDRPARSRRRWCRSATFDDRGDRLPRERDRDVTDRRLTEERLEASERRYREVVPLASCIILRWTRDGRITLLNDYGQRFSGYTEAESCGEHVVGTIVPESALDQGSTFTARLPCGAEEVT